jgi:glycosyltransferase involved in cell wall biosynthesis
VPRIVTLSKYPPYHSGHAKQALWNNRALVDLTGSDQHQVTYCGVSSDPDDDAGPGVHVHHVGAMRENRRVPDGHLMQATAAKLHRVAMANDIDVILTYYVDPHAAVANRVADALALTGKRPILMHSLEGSDMLDSIWEHLSDGSASVLIADTLKADVVCAVSDYTAQRFLAAVETVGGQRLLDQVAGSIELRYPGLPPRAFAAPAEQSLFEFRSLAGLRHDSRLVSTIGRLEKEKGLETVIALAELAERRAPELEFVIAGTGSLGETLVKRAEAMPNLTVLCAISSHDAQCLRATSAVGVFPTRPIQGFVETFCVSALEYEALGVPVLASAIGGVPEATPGEVGLMAPGASAEEWWTRLTGVLASRAAYSRIAADFAAGFTSARSAARIVDLIDRVPRRGVADRASEPRYMAQ